MIEFKNIQIKYGDFTAIDGLNLVINRGEFFTLLGPSGCGKTTTLRALAGFITPNQGSIEINGRNITDVPVEKRKIGIVFQSYALFPSMSVYENIAFGLRVQKARRDVIAGKIEAVAQKIDLTRDQLQRNVAELSGGQQQRVALARAIIMEPDILCLDEPLSNLDAKLRVGLRGELKRLQKDLGITTIYVTHDQEEALTLSDRIAVFNKGKIEQTGTPDEIYNHSATGFVCDFIGDINRLSPDILEEVFRQSGRKAAGNIRGYIRIERVNTRRYPGCNITLSGVVADREYYGIYTKYTFDTGGEFIKGIEKNDGRSSYKAGEKTDLYFDINDVMIFEE
jgi:iron(III) transport system ATP-binding protein